MSLCKTCFEICETHNSFPIQGELQAMLIFSIPELDLNITDNPVLCKQCRTTLKIVNDFKKKCLHTQQKIFIISNQAFEDNSNPISKTPVVAEVVKKVSPFNLKLKARIYKNQNVEFPTCSSKDVLKIKNGNLEASIPDSIDSDKEDFLNLLDNSVNVSNPKIEKLENMIRSDYLKTPKSNGKLFECKLCNKSYKYKCQLNVHQLSSVEHQLNKSKETVVPSNRYKCVNCSYSTKYKIGLNKHSLFCSTEDSNKRCFNSTKQTAQLSKKQKITNGKSKLLDHSTKAHKIIKMNYLSKNGSPLNKECSICKRKFKNSRGLYSHMTKHSVQKSSEKKYTDLGYKPKEAKVTAKYINEKSTEVITNISEEQFRHELSTSCAVTQFSGVQDIGENNQITKNAEYMEQSSQQSAKLSFQYEKNPCDNEEILFEVEFVPTISEDEIDDQDTAETENDTNEDLVSPTNTLEEKDQNNGAIFQDTVIC